MSAEIFLKDMPTEPEGRDEVARRTLKIVCVALLPVIVLLVLWHAYEAFFLLFGGIVLAAVFDAAARGLGHVVDVAWKWRAGAVVFLSIVFLALVGWWAGPKLYDEGRGLLATLVEEVDALSGIAPDGLMTRSDDVTDAAGQESWRVDGGEASSEAGSEDTRQAAAQDDAAETSLGRAGEGEKGPVENMVEGAVSAAGAGSGDEGLMQGLQRVLALVLSTFANAFLIFFIGAFLVFAPSSYVRGVLHLVPKGSRVALAHTFEEAGETLRWWLIGKLVSMAIIAVFTGAGLFLLDYPFALPLALLAGALAFVPNLGPITTYVPIVLVGLSEDGTTALYGAGVYALAQTLESYLITPLVQERAVALPPALILFLQVLFGLLFGLFGIALAVPIAAVARVFINHLYVRDTLGDTSISATPH